ncbi:MAG: SCO family protein [Deltaproteobacteria bacterium]|nr:SCO family protein [Deltaproteobacteria bacterium]
MGAPPWPCRAVLAGALWVLVPSLARGMEPLPKQLEGVTVAEHLGQKLDLSLRFTDHYGRAVRLGDYLTEGKPVLLTLNYYSCPQLCSLQLNALVQSIKGMGRFPGDGYRMVTVSIDPREKPPLAKGKRGSYLGALGKPTADWSFLVGDQQAITALASQVGFKYRYDAKQDQYAHPAVVFFLTSDGKVARYLYGIDFPPRDLRFALMETSAGRFGSPIEKFILSCFHYDAATGRYGPFALGVMRLGGVVTVFILAIVLALYWRQERHRRHRQVIP